MVRWYILNLYDIDVAKSDSHQRHQTGLCGHWDRQRKDVKASATSSLDTWHLCLTLDDSEASAVAYTKWWSGKIRSNAFDLVK